MAGPPGRVRATHQPQHGYRDQGPDKEFGGELHPQYAHEGDGTAQQEDCYHPQADAYQPSQEGKGQRLAQDEA